MERDRRDDLLAWMGFLFALLLAVLFVLWWLGGAPMKGPEGVAYFKWGSRHYAAGTWTTPPPEEPHR
jgi:hypothetical protein